MIVMNICNTLLITSVETNKKRGLKSMGIIILVHFSNKFKQKI